MPRSNRIIIRLVLNRPVVVFRDVAMYIPILPTGMCTSNGKSVTATIQKIKADLLLLNKQHLHDYTQPNQLQTALDPNFAQTYRFLPDALNENVTGYTMLSRTIRHLYLSTPLYEQLFVPPMI